MKTNRSRTAELIKALLQAKNPHHFIFKANAEEVVTPPTPAPTADPTATEPTPTLNFEQMIAQARKEEKDKLYPRIKKLEADNKALTDSVNTYLLQNATLKKELEELKNASGESEEVTKLNARIKKLEEENETLKASTPNEEELRKKIEAEYEVKLYRQEQIDANKDSIVSVLLGNITGSTKEEIDASIKSAIEQTATIKKDLGLLDDEGKPTTKSKTASKSTTRKPPVANPETGHNDEYTMEYIQSLDPRSKEYAEFREKMGLH